jgi:hypothetical protein
MNNTDYISLTELWQDGEFNKVGSIINAEMWNPRKVSEFCAYFCKYLGAKQLEILYKFL